MDVPMPAGPTSGVRAAGAPWRVWVEQRRRPVIVGAFVAAALLGVLIGLLTAPGPKESSGSAGAATAAPARSPAQPAAPWEGSRSPGTAVNVTLNQSQSPVVRTALSWAAADDALAKAGEKTWSEIYLAEGSNAQAAAQSEGALTDKSIAIPQGLLYGAVQGQDTSTDQYWAVGYADASDTGNIQVPRLHVWERVGSGAWKVVASGSGACSSVPSALTQLWAGQLNATCAG